MRRPDNWSVPRQERERIAREIAAQDGSTKAEIEEAARDAGISATATGASSTPTKADWIAAVLGQEDAEAPESTTEPVETGEPEEEHNG